MRRVVLRCLGGSGGLLGLLALALIALPLPGPSALEAAMQRVSLQILSVPLRVEPPPVLRLPSVPQASPALQLAALDGLAQALPAARGVLLWLPNEGLAAAEAWSAEGALLRAALARAGAMRGESLLAAGAAGWRQRLGRWLARAPRAEPPPGAVALARASAEGIAVSPILAAYLAGPTPLAARWRPGRGLQLNDGRWLSGPDGLVYPHWPAYRAQPRELRPGQLALDPAPLVVAGALGDPALDAAASILAGLEQGAYSYTPWWSGLLDRGLIVLLLLVFVGVMPRISATSGGLLVVVLALALLGVQFGWQSARSQWLALGGAGSMLLLGYPLAWLGAYRAKAAQALRERADQALLALSRAELRQGELDLARQHLLQVSPLAERLESLYELAVAYERRRQYLPAREVFMACAAQRRGFRDVGRRLQVLAEVNAVPGGGAAAGTLLMPQAALEKPLLGRYRLQRELGRGGMGVVYLGDDPRIGRQVAIKTLDMSALPREDSQEFKLRFLREAEAAGRLSHPRIVTVYDVGDEGDLAFIAMDYAPGRPLSEFTEPGSLLPVDTVYRLMAQVADGLDYAHDQGVIHRDIKPANLIYDAARDSVKITDFGVARIGDSRRTRTGAVIGSPSYMAPEQIAGGKVSGSADLFSLGVTCYQLLCGRLPFRGDSLAQLAYQISQGRPPELRRLRPELPASAGRIVGKALGKRPADRFRRGAEMAEALRRALAGRKRGVS